MDRKSQQLLKLGNKQYNQMKNQCCCFWRAAQMCFVCFRIRQLLEEDALYCML